MAWKPVISPKCCKCEKNVYHVEQVIGPGGHIYHEQCFKCATCKKRLDSTLLTEKNQEIYCKSCYAKDFGPKGYGFAGGSSFLTTGVYKSDDDRLISSVPNERELEKNDNSADNSPVLKTPNNQLDSHSTLLSPTEVPPFPSVASRKNLYVKNSSESNTIETPIYNTSRSISPQPSIFNKNPSPTPKRFSIKADICARCNKNVYINEMIGVIGKKFHINCCRCFKCNKQLDSLSLNEHENELFCKQCYSKNFGPKGYGYAGGSAFLTSNGAI